MSHPRAVWTFAELEGVRGVMQCTLQVGKRNIDSARTGLLATNTATGPDHGMGMLGFQCPKIPQRIAVNIQSRLQPASSPLGQCCAVESRHRIITA